jgi:divalent metal cation (Fe/Co/Zn/Cd) transporter
LSNVVATRRLRRRAFLLEYVTVAWNIFEGVAAILVGLAASSVALVGFGLDSSVEVVASLVVVWELQGGERRRERRALRVIGTAYLVVAAYILFEALRSLIAADRPSGSPLGVALTSMTAAAMLALFAGKQWVGSRLGSQTVLADARFSLVDGLLAASVMAGLVLNLVAGWWWADPAFALVLAAAAGREGIGSLSGAEG